MLAPGFIDMHSHADFTLPSYPARDQLAGPGRDHGGHRQLRLLTRATGRRPGPRRRAAGRVSRARAGPRLGVADRSASTWPGWTRRGRPSTSSRSSATACSAWRSSARRIGRPPRPSSTRCATAAAAALADGAWGMSTGLVYPPGRLRRDRRDRRGRGGPVARRRPVRQPHPQRERRPGRGAPRGDRDRPPARRPGRGVPPQGGRPAEPRPRRRGAGDPRRARAAGGRASTTTPTRTRPAARS